MKSEEKVRELLAIAGIEVNGSNPWDIQVYDKRFYARVLSKGSLGLGESYMDRWCDIERVDQFIDKVLSSGVKEEIKNLTLFLHVVRAKVINLQSVSRAFQVGEEHYDVGNDLYKKMLDKRMVYTCGYWSSAQEIQTLDEAQEAKLDLVCRKLNFKKGQKILDIGCGWGSFAKFAAEKYGVEVVGITISNEQAKLAQENVKGLPIEIRIQDYRDLNEEFDHIVSLGMFEHVGYKNYQEYMKIANRSLKEGGMFLLHTIGSNKTVFTADPWFDKYIFPNGMLPSVKQIGEAIDGLFVVEDWHNFGADYDRTLMEWFKNFDASWDEIKDQYSDRFYRMWKYYLLSMAGAFRSRKNNQLWQIVLSKEGVRGGYTTVR